MTETEARPALVRIVLTETSPLSLLTGNPLRSRQTQVCAKEFQVPKKMHRTGAPKSSGFSLRTRTQAHLSAASRYLEHHHSPGHTRGRPMAGGEKPPPESPLLVLIHKSGDNCSRKLRASPEKTVSTPNKSA